MLNHWEGDVESSLADRVRRLEDIEAIRQLKALYCAACDDNHNPERVAALFATDGLWEGANIGIRAVGHEAIKGYIGGVRDGGRIRNSAHIVTNPIIDVRGDKATGEWRLVMLYTGLTPDGGLQYQRIIGFYRDEFVRAGDGWRFQALRVTVEEANPYSVEPSRLD
jgi:hypothetical protein